MRILILHTDAFGGRGGIAKVNRDLLRAITSHPDVSEVVAMPRIIVDEVGALPRRLTYISEAARGKAQFVKCLAARLSRDRRFDLVICGHINLLLLAALAAAWTRASLLQIAHGIEVWGPLPTPVSSLLTRRLVRHIDALVTVSDVTRDRMSSWLDFAGAVTFVIPNSIDARTLGPGPKSSALAARYGLQDATVIMTMARLSSGERYKGIDEVIELLPRLIDDIPNLKYLICGDGDDRGRLETKVRDLGLSDRVKFAGYVAEDEKVDHFRLANAFVMPGRGEGFGIVYLEALACGIPVVASSADASREAVLDGEMGEVVDPDDPRDIARGIRAALARPRIVPSGLEYFSNERFSARWHAVIDLLRDEPSRQERRIEEAAVIA